MRGGGSLLVWGAVADMAVQHDKGGAALRLAENLEGMFDALDVVGIADAQDVPFIRQEARRNVLREGDICIPLDRDVVVVENPTEKRLPQELETVLFRIVQESLNNIHRHSGSRTAEIRITRSAADIRVQIRDEGGGMRRSTAKVAAGEAIPLGVGIAGMRERVRQIGGRFEVRSEDRGTAVEVVLPLSQVST